MFFSQASTREFNYIIKNEILTSFEFVPLINFERISKDFWKKDTDSSFKELFWVLSL